MPKQDGLVSISASECLSHPVQVHKHLPSQHCPAFSVHGWNYKNVQHKKKPIKILHFPPSPLLCPNTHQRRKASSPASIAYFMYCSFSHLSGIMARELPFSPYFPLSRAVCGPSGKVNPQPVEAKEMRGEGETVDFIFKSQKAPAYWN